MALSIKFPIKIGITKDFEDFTNIEEKTRFELKNVLFTNPGERISVPSFGVGIKTYLFEPNTNATTFRIRNSIIAQVDRYLEDIELTDVVVQQTRDNSIYVSIQYKILDNPTTSVFEVTVSTSSAMETSY